MMRKDPLGLDAIATRADELKAFAPDAQQAMWCAQHLAQQNGSAKVEGVHLLMGAMQSAAPDSQLRALVQISGLKWDEVWLYAHSALEKRDALADSENMSWGDSALPVLRAAGDEARRGESAQVEATHLFIACFRPQKTAGLAEVLAPLGVSAAQLRLHLRALRCTQVAAVVAGQSPLSRLTAHGERALEAAHAQMRASFCGRISTLHLLLGVLENSDGDATAALQTLFINVDELRARARAALTSDGEIAGPERRFTPAAKRALDRAKAAAREGGRTHIGSGDLLIGLLPQRALWVERAQFGAHLDDPAAPILRDVDADLVRAIFNGERAAAPTRQAQAWPRNLVRVRSPAQVILAFQVMVAFALKSSESRGDLASGRFLISLLVGTIIVTALLAIGLTMFSKNRAHKSSGLAIFIGALLGGIGGMMLAQRM